MTRRIQLTVTSLFLATAVVIPFGLFGGRWLGERITPGQKRAVEWIVVVGAALLAVGLYVRHVRGIRRRERVPGVLVGEIVADAVPELASTAA